MVTIRGRIFFRQSDLLYVLGHQIFLAKAEDTPIRHSSNSSSYL